MSRDNRHAFFDVPWIRPAGLLATALLVVSFFFTGGCSTDAPAKSKTEEKKEEKVVTDLNIQTDSSPKAGESAKDPKQEKEDDLETLPFDEEPQGEQNNALPSLNGPD